MNEKEGGRKIENQRQKGEAKEKGGRWERKDRAETKKERQRIWRKLGEERQERRDEKGKTKEEGI
jgi:hypothetical protein